MSGMILPFGGATPKIHPEAFVAETAVVIGDVEIGAGTSIWYGCVVRGDINKIRIGRNTNVQDGTVIHVNHDRYGDGGMPTFIGDDVTIGHMALIHACTIEDECLIGMRATVMDGAVIGRNSIVGAAALVTAGTIIPPGSLVLGSPAKVKRELDEQERASILELADKYTRVAQAHKAKATG